MTSKEQQFGSYSIVIRTWESVAEWKAHLALADCDVVTFEDHESESIDIVSIDLRSDRGGNVALRIGILADKHGIDVTPVVEPQFERLVIGYSQYAVIISLVDGVVRQKLCLESPFNSFKNVPSYGLLLVFHDIGVVAIDGTSAVRWAYSKDVITGATCEGNRLLLTFMDSPDVSLRIEDGSNT
jgi:hypothetical protein